MNGGFLISNVKMYYFRLIILYIMKNIILLILFLTISIFTSCATCEGRPDNYSYLNDFNKSILYFSSDTELKFLRNNTEEIILKSLKL